MTYLTKNVYDVIKQRSLFGFEERKKEVNYMDARMQKYLENLSWNGESSWV